MHVKLQMLQYAGIQLFIFSPITVIPERNGPISVEDSGIFRGTKFSLFEGGIRVPAAINWPGKIKAGEVREQLVVNADWMPTLAELCGIDLDTICCPSKHRRMFPAESDGIEFIGSNFKKPFVDNHQTCLSLSEFTMSSRTSQRPGPITKN